MLYSKTFQKEMKTYLGIEAISPRLRYLDFGIVHW